MPTYIYSVRCSFPKMEHQQADFEEGFLYQHMCTSILKARRYIDYVVKHSDGGQAKLQHRMDKPLLQRLNAGKQFANVPLACYVNDTITAESAKSLGSNKRYYTITAY